MPNSRSQRFSSTFSFRSCLILCIIFRSMIHFCTSWKIWIQFHCLTTEYSVVESLFFAKALLFHWFTLTSLWKNQLSTYVWVYFCFISVLFHHYMCLSWCQYHTILINKSWNQEVFASQFTYSLKSNFAILVSLHFQMNLRVSFSISAIKPTGILMGLCSIDIPVLGEITF